MPKIMFGLADKNGNLCTLHCSSNNGADFCGDTSTELWSGSDEGAVFLLESKEKVQALLNEKVGWFNSGHETPQISDYTKERVHLVKVTLTVEDA